jgi:hypothetical protein
MGGLGIVFEQRQRQSGHQDQIHGNDQGDMNHSALIYGPDNNRRQAETEQRHQSKRNVAIRLEYRPVILPQGHYADRCDQQSENHAASRHQQIDDGQGNNSGDPAFQVHGLL